MTEYEQLVKDLRKSGDQIAAEMTEYEQLVKDLRKSGDQIAAEITPKSLDLLHMAVGISGEAGELLDAVKKVTIYNKPVDLENVIEELGDLEFYMEGLRQNLGISRQATLDSNITKLRKRYGEKYSDKSAQDRVDKYREAVLTMTPEERDRLQNGRWEPETDISMSGDDMLDVGKLH